MWRRIKKKLVTMVKMMRRIDLLKMKTFCLSASWSMNVSITAKAEGENLFRSSILIMMIMMPGMMKMFMITIIQMMMR